MPFRVNPDPARTLMAALAQSRDQENRALEEISSGRRVNTPSDDPAAAASLVQVSARLQQNDQFTRNISGLRAQLQVADSTLSSATVVLTRAIALATQGANGTLTQAERNALAGEVNGLKQQMLSLANLTFQGNYVFAGTKVNTPPYVLDPAQPSGVRYDGNANANSVEIATGVSLPVNLPGSQIFSNSSADAFQSLADLENALRTNGNIAATVTSVKNAFDNLSTQRVFYGNALNRLNASENFLSRESLELSRQESDLAAADLAETISALTKAQNAHQAILQAAGRATRLTLLDFLK
ncbi:MAG: flagellar hook-associated protein FlgL [Acidobacteria bacterium]|nr:flagellar hook-associated protein FlgL [Acidobacteriota bacterium]MBI3662980.1 flagellar hook-associated protein FlgL [Acidobacteriota bacterium]